MAEVYMGHEGKATVGWATAGDKMDNESIPCDSVRVPFSVKNNLQEQLEKYYASSTSGSRESGDSLKVNANSGSGIHLHVVRMNAVYIATYKVETYPLCQVP